MSVHRGEGGGGKAKSGVQAGVSPKNKTGPTLEDELTSSYEPVPGSPLSDPQSPGVTYVTPLLEAVTCELQPDSAEEENVTCESDPVSPSDINY